MSYLLSVEEIRSHLRSIADVCAELSEGMQVPEVANAIRKWGATLKVTSVENGFKISAENVRVDIVERLNEAEIIDKTRAECEKLADHITNDDHLEPQEAEGAQHVAIAIRALRKMS